MAAVTGSIVGGAISGIGSLLGSRESRKGAEAAAAAADPRTVLGGPLGNAQFQNGQLNLQPGLFGSFVNPLAGFGANLLQNLGVGAAPQSIFGTPIGQFAPGAQSPQNQFGGIFGGAANRLDLRNFGQLGQSGSLSNFGLPFGGGGGAGVIGGGLFQPGSSTFGPAAPPTGGPSTLGQFAGVPGASDVLSRSTGLADVAQGNLLAQLGSSLGFDPAQFGRQQFGGANTRAQQVANLSRGQLRDILGAQQTFDPNQFAQTQLSRLNELAAPGERNAAQGLAQQLFGTGRLGTTGGAQAFGELGQALERAQTERALQAVGLAGQEQDRFGRLSAQAFGQAGGDISRLFSQQAGGLQLGQAQQGFLGQQAQNAFGPAFAGVGGIGSALGLQQSLFAQQLQNALAPILAAQGFAETPLSLGNLSIGAGSAGGSASNAIAALAQGRGDQLAGFFGGLGTTIANRFPGNTGGGGSGSGFGSV